MSVATIEGLSLLLAVVVCYFLCLSMFVSHCYFVVLQCLCYVLFICVIIVC